MAAPITEINSDTPKPTTESTTLTNQITTMVGTCSSKPSQALFKLGCS